MRIIIDMQGAQTESRFRGIGRYSLSLTLAIARAARRHEVFLALNGLLPDSIGTIREAFAGVLPRENIRVWNAPGPTRETDPANGTRREIAERVREAFILSLEPDVVLVTSLFEGLGDDAVVSLGRFDAKTPTAVILYDLIPLLNPDIHFRSSTLRQEYYARKIESLKQSKLLLAISESARSEALRGISFAPEDVANISAACDVSFKKIALTEAEQQAIRTKFSIPQEFVLYTGGADERKNLARLVTAYGKLPADVRATHRLIMAGRMPGGEVSALQEQAREAGLGSEELVFTGYISDEELLALYNMCKLFVFPSTHEGFGLPPLEAMSCGAAVIGANNTSLPEVIGSTEAMFDPESVDAIRDKMHQALTDDAFRALLLRNAETQAAAFSWEKSALKAIEALERFEPQAAKGGTRPARTSTSEPVQTAKAIKNQLVAALGPLLHDRTDGEVAAIARSITASIRPDNTGARIFVDISELVQRDSGTGIQRVTRSILKELLENPPADFDIVPVYATMDSKGYFAAKNFLNRFNGKNPQHTTPDEAIDFYPEDIFLGLDFQSHVVCAQRSALDAMHLAGVRVLFVVYDLLPVQMPQHFVPGTAQGFGPWLNTIVAYDGALCISNSVADDLRAYIQQAHSARLKHFKISWFHIGADIESSNPSKGLPTNAMQVLQSLQTRPSFLTVSTVESRKGHTQILDAFELLWSCGFDANLVIVGRQGWHVDRLADRLRRHSEADKRLFWLDSASDEYLEQIYGASTCLVAASEGEGFGLPLIEAARHKIPIIARDLPVFKEVAGQNAYYFHGITADALADAIKSWAVLFGEQSHPRSNAMPWLTWRQSTQNLLKLVCCADADTDAPASNTSLSKKLSHE